jgi:L-cysteate sulfo-lyase
MIQDGNMKTRYLLKEIKSKLNTFPKVNIAVCPTPLQYLPNLSAELNGPNIYIKRDDLTGLALGGNKTRILQYVMADLNKKHADVVIATAYAQSNLCRQTAAAASRLGVKALLVLKGLPGNSARGNLALDVLLGAELHFIETNNDDFIFSYITELIEKLEGIGCTPYFIDSYGATAHFSTLAYLECFIEIYEQSNIDGFTPSALIVGSASGGTQSGLNLGTALLNSEINIIGVNPMEWPADFVQNRTSINLNTAAIELGYSIEVPINEITVLGNYVGNGYGIPTKLSREAQKLFAEKEGIILDPVYTAKAAGAMIDLIRRGVYHKKQNVVLIHTGGVPTVFVRDIPYDNNKVIVITKDKIKNK